jgi:metal-responsive CopG/Arc/MetJ family transcriptional regulator
MVMPRRQSLVQLSDELLSALDSRAARQGRSRSALIREAVEQYLAADAEAAVDRTIVAAYERLPQTSDAWTGLAVRETIAAEPW